MKNSIILSLALVSFVLYSCEEAFEAIEGLDGPSDCEASRDPINEANDTIDYFISSTEMRSDFTDEEKAEEIERLNNGRQQLINDLNNTHCR